MPTWFCHRSVFYETGGFSEEGKVNFILNSKYFYNCFTKLNTLKYKTIKPNFCLLLCLSISVIVYRFFIGEHGLTNIKLLHMNFICLLQLFQSSEKVSFSVILLLTLWQGFQEDVSKPSNI